MWLRDLGEEAGFVDDQAAKPETKEDFTDWLSGLESEESEPSIALKRKLLQKWKSPLKGKQPQSLWEKRNLSLPIGCAAWNPSRQKRKPRGRSRN